MVSLTQSCGCATTYVLMRRSHGWPLIMDVLVLYILEGEFFFALSRSTFAHIGTYRQA